MEEFNALRLRDVSTLSEEERVMLRKIGEQLTEDERLKLIGKVHGIKLLIRLVVRIGKRFKDGNLHRVMNCI